jgi:outer membrane protein with beta-barrel domain
MRFRFVSALIFALGISALPAGAQFLSVGVKAGVPLNDGFDAGSAGSTTAITNRYLIGAEIEVGLPFHFAVEGDALYRHYVIFGKGAGEWQFPILLKYRFKGVPLVRPFIDAGLVFNHVSDIPNLTANNSSPGFAIGGGLDFHVLLLHLTPEFRYVRISDQNYANPLVTSNQNQAQFLVGFTF